MERTDISVIIPLSGAPAMLPVTLGHLEIQTYPSARFEIIIAPCCVPDRVVQQLDRYLEGSPMRVRCMSNGADNPCVALNRAVDQADGQWILFLDEDLLAGSHLVENHVTSQERHGDRAVIVGGVERHPQAHAGCFTKWGSEIAQPAHGRNRAINALHWRSHNLSIARSLFIDTGGFDEAYSIGGLFDVDLAWRLAREGIAGYYQHNATAYALRAADINSEQRRHYAMGYSLHRLMEKTKSPEVWQHFMGSHQALRYGAAGLMLMPRLRMCHMLSQNTGLFEKMFNKVLRHRCVQGYRDARSGRPPRSFSTTSEQSQPAPKQTVQPMH